VLIDFGGVLAPKAKWAMVLDLSEKGGTDTLGIDQRGEQARRAGERLVGAFRAAFPYMACTCSICNGRVEWTCGSSPLSVT
jgi:hypothetical protein